MPSRRFRRKSRSNSTGAPDDEPVAVASTPRVVADLLASQQGNDDDNGMVVQSDDSAPPGFVTQPPKPAKGLTGKISTLFRRESSSKEHESYNEQPTSTRSEIRNTTTTKVRKQSSSSKVAAAAASSDDDNRSTNSRGSATSGKRIFYSSHDDDDDSDDSYESRTSRRSRRSRKASDGTTTTGGDYYDDYSTYTGTTSGGARGTIQRYRGFSTSIKSLFLDESLVCGACGCFGLILSYRTEFLLQLRNERRGALSPRSFKSDKRSMPSKIIATALVLTLLLMFSTFIIWGFGNGDNVAGDYINGYDYYKDDSSNNKNGNGNNGQWWDDYLQKDDDAVGYNNNNYNNNYQNDDDAVNNNQNGDDDGGNADDDQNNNNDDGNDDDDANAADDDDANQDDDNGNNGRRMQHNSEYSVYEINHPPHGIFKIRDYQEYLWEPIFDIVRNEWYRDDQLDDSNDLHRRKVEEEYVNQGNDQSFHSNYHSRRDLASDIRMALFFVFLVFLGILGRRRRMRTRFYLARARAQEDHLYYASSDEAAARRVAYDDAREDQYEGACSHTMCGCYPADEDIYPVRDDESEVHVSDTGLFKRKRKRHNEDIVARGFNCLMSCCCGVICKCWLQCLSICALAQEAREIRLLIPPRYQRIDYITHQPFHEYQEAVNDLRRGWLGKARRMAGIMPHFNALSRLSRYIIILSVGTVLTIVATLLFNPRAAFSWQDAVVLVATFVQSFLVLFFVHWIFHKSDLSLDAVIKMFAAGFLIATPTAFFFEGLMVNVALFLFYSFYEIMEAIIGEDFSTWVVNNFRVIWIIGELLNAYLVAAVTEELCKYYSFRCVEHPDLIFLTGLQRETQDQKAVDGGLVQYPFGSHQVQILAKDGSFDEKSVSSKSHRSNNSRKSRREKLLNRTGTRDDEFQEDELDVRTRRQKAMAITTGMISVAVGLACAENFLYVFVLGGALADSNGNRSHSMLEAWMVLFFRSIFPVHALAAAMQSINMVRKFVEGEDQRGHRVGVGRIILPAVLLHGTFDAILMAINVYIETAWDSYLAENDGEIGDGEPYNALLVNGIAWVGITSIMIAGIVWYVHENRRQRDRLKLLEEQDKATQSESWANSVSSKKIDDGEIA